MNSARLKILRTHLELNQEEMSSKLGITQANYSLIESGHRKIPKRLTESLINVFNVNPLWWETGSGEITHVSLKHIPAVSWTNLEGIVQGLNTIRLFSDCDKICEYTGPAFGPIPSGSTIALRFTIINRLVPENLIVCSHKEGSFIGYFKSSDPDYIFLGNEKSALFKLERMMITSVYRVVGVMLRLA
ncbi:helix-turn-helix domain-containing protein [Dyadobacter helix]|nr:helix-turn-helix transcriptional regulator [Dyadobacter sp. CECT 9275]